MRALRSFLAFVALLWVACFLVAVCVATGTFARDLGQWENSDPATREWFQTLMQPDVPTASCCGEADAYWADTVHVRDGKTFVMVTDDRPDAPLQRPHVDVGTEIEVPDAKLKWDRGNPTARSCQASKRPRSSSFGMLAKRASISPRWSAVR